MFRLTKRLSKKGFTLIELMIVIAIIGLLSVVLIPKVQPLKDQAKNNVVEANVYIVRSFLESRAGTDRINIVTSLGTKTDTASIADALKLIKDGRGAIEATEAISGIDAIIGIGSEMGTTFSGSSAMKNPFNNSTLINSTNPNIQNNIPGNSSVVIGYHTGVIPSNVANITSTVNTPGVTAVIVYKDGYVLYGVDNFGSILQPTLVDMPNNVPKSPDNPIINPTLPQVATPIFSYTFDNKGGSYTLSCGQENAIIRYTIDGKEPDLSSPQYTNPIIMSGAMITIKAYATLEGFMDSNVTSVVYTLPTITPIITPSFSFSGDFSAENIIAKSSEVKFSITLSPADLGGTLVVANNGVSMTANSAGIYTFTAPAGSNQVCTITAILKTDTQQFEGKLILTTTDK